MKEIEEHEATHSLVDEVEERLLNYFKEHNVQIGDSLPKELELVETLGVARSVVREALSRLRMMGLIKTRTKRGMILSEPNLIGGIQRVISPHFFRPSTLLDLLELRISLEIGFCTQIVDLITDEQIEALSQTVERSVFHENKSYDLVDEFAFHTMLYDISQNRFVKDFQLILHPVMNYVKKNYESELHSINESLSESEQLVTHSDLLAALKTKKAETFRLAMERHFFSYRSFIKEQRILISNP
ncbi:MAG: GntR family transcriptional regulator [Bacteroidaceae bacterium]